MSDGSGTGHALGGLRVLDIATLGARPWVATFLGEVIKVEHPDGGDGMRRFGPSCRASASCGGRCRATRSA